MEFPGKNNQRHTRIERKKSETEVSGHEMLCLFVCVFVCFTLAFLCCSMRFLIDLHGVYVGVN